MGLKRVRASKGVKGRRSTLQKNKNKKTAHEQAAWIKKIQNVFLLGTECHLAVGLIFTDTQIAQISQML